MSKAKHTDAEVTTASAPVSITIQDIAFHVPSPYTEGHPLSAEEAATLNQVLHENLRNNFAKTVKSAKDEADKTSTPLDTSALQSKFAEYAAGYKFNGKRQSRAPVDPVAREAHKIAKSMILEALRKKNINIKTLPEGKLDGLVLGLIEKDASITTEAKRRIAALQSVGQMSLSDLGMDETPAAAAE